MRKHASQLADYIDKQKDLREKCLIQYQKQVLEKKKEKDAERGDGTKDDYNSFKTNSCESIANAATFVLRAGWGDEGGGPDSMSGCFGRPSKWKNNARTPASPTKRTKNLLDPIRRWNSFHMRDRKTTPSQMKSLEEFRREFSTEKDGSAVENVAATPSMAATGLMGALPRVLALRSEYHPSDITMTETMQNKKQLSVETEHVEKSRAFSQGDVGKTLPLHLSELRKENGMTLTKQVTRDLLLPSKRNSNNKDSNVSDDGKSSNEGKKSEKVLKGCATEPARSRTRSEGGKDDKDKMMRSSPKKLMRKKTKENLYANSMQGDKPRRWSERDDESEKLVVEIGGKCATYSRLSSSWDVDIDAEDSDW